MEDDGAVRLLDDRLAGGPFDGVEGITFMPEPEGFFSTRWLTCITIDPEGFGADRETVRLALEAEDIESRPTWKPMHLQPVFRDCRTYGGSVSERIFELGLCLPSGSSLAKSDLDRVCDILLSCRGKRAVMAAES